VLNVKHVVGKKRPILKLKNLKPILVYDVLKQITKLKKNI